VGVRGKITTEGTEFRGVYVTKPVFSVYSVVNYYFCNHSYHHVWARSVGGRVCRRVAGRGLLHGRVVSRAAWGGGAERKITTEGTEYHGVYVTNPVFSV
jgi:hypothetical protein